jgi:hypothetical protein
MIKTLLLGAISATLLCSCGTMGPIGVVYSDVNKPQQATSASGVRTGKSESKSYCGLVALGDSSIEAAKKNAGITTVSAVDTKVYSILGIYNKFTTTVSGN